MNEMKFYANNPHFQTYDYHRSGSVTTIIQASSMVSLEGSLKDPHKTDTHERNVTFFFFQHSALIRVPLSDNRRIIVKASVPKW